MSDYRKEFIDSVERSMSTMLDHDTLEKAVCKIIGILDDYEIVRRNTDLVVYDDANERALKRYCATLLIEGKSKRTIYGHRKKLERFFNFVGKPYTDVGVYDVRYYLGTEKERGLKNSTIEHTRTVISGFFSWLTMEEEIPKNPCASIKPIKVPKEDRHAFNAVELDALRHTCNTPRERALIEVLVSSGVRAAELCNLTLRDVNFDSMELYVRQGKGGKDRTTYISDVAKMHLQMYIKQRKETGDVLFYSKKHSKLSVSGIEDIVKRIGKRAGVTNVHPHRFRRTLATRLVASGMPIQEVQRILGHTDISTTMRYVCMDDQKVKYSYRQHIA